MARMIEEQVEQGAAGNEHSARAYEQDGIRFPDHPIDPRRVVLSYDRPSDTLLLFLYGRERRSVVVGGADYVFSLVDPATDEFVGLQIEDFLARAVKDEPGLISLLDHAELRGITIDEVRRERQAALGYGGRIRAWLRREWRRPGSAVPTRKNEAIRSLLSDDRLGLPINVPLGST